ncbi:PAS domain-containing protein [Polyangium aurulentum]|uniref:PAS domain-containing protein n=1 Tax=Polyangium aurulentum TaxID=2567896 RepID=UPI00146D2900|nr:PAS domain-containing protein [Polyangium aurulentum]UQA62875.1 PAS domain-containing protein [Polyangium aurulentum]
MSEIAEESREIEALRARVRALEEREAALREELAHERRIKELCPFIVYFFDLIEQRNVYANRSFAATLGYGEEEIRAMGDEVLVRTMHPEDLTTLGAYTERLGAAADGEFITVEYRVLRRDGTIRWCKSIEQVYSREPDGRVRLVLGFVRDVTEEREAAAERIALERSMLAMSTPLVPIAEGVVAMPLVGRIDGARAQQILEVLLEGITSQQAIVAILDITGVKVVDAEVADGLLKAAQAADLLGAEVVLTGIRPEVAQTIVDIGADMRKVVARSTLAAGIAHALRRTGKR